jgi:hypothetical protein
MAESESGDNLPEDFARNRFVECTSDIELALEAATRALVHEDVIGMLGLENVAKADNVRVRKCLQGLHFPP